jgi:hypothetical protein
MIRPPSIVRYEQLYLASFALGLVASALSWNQRAAIFAANPMLAGMPWILSATVVIGIVISLTLWHFTARAPSIVAKWVVVVIAGFSVIGIATNLFALVAGRSPSLAASLISLLVSLLYIVAATLLFRADAKIWFGEDTIGDTNE